MLRRKDYQEHRIWLYFLTQNLLRLPTPKVCIVPQSEKRSKFSIQIPEQAERAHVISSALYRTSGSNFTSNWSVQKTGIPEECTLGFFLHHSGINQELILKSGSCVVYGVPVPI